MSEKSRGLKGRKATSRGSAKGVWTKTGRKKESCTSRLMEKSAGVAAQGHWRELQKGGG